jgi:hypothetical protein
VSEHDDPNGILIRFPGSGHDPYAPPPIPSFADTVPPPESPEETTMELPPIPSAPDPATALGSEGIPSEPYEEYGDDEDYYEDGEYVQPRSLADRLGDWLEHRTDMARARHEAEKPFREAEIARKSAHLQARTEHEVAMMQHNSKLRQAHLKAQGDRAAARGKADADRMKSSSSGLGADKGSSKGGGGGSSRGGGGGGSRGSSGSDRPGSRGGANSGGSGGRSGSGSSNGGGGKGGKKGPERSSDGRTPGSGRNGAAGGSKGSQGGSGGSGKGGGGGSKGDRGRAHHGPASSASAERARGRQDRAAARQGARQERRSTEHAAGLADRTKDRDRARANKQQVWEDRRAARLERTAARRAKRQAADSADSERVTLAEALAEEAARRWDKRRADAEAGPEKVNLSKDKDTDGKGDKEGPDGATDAGKDGPAPDEPGKGSKAGGGPSGGSKRRRRGGRWRTSRKGQTRDKSRRTRRGRAGRTGGTGGAGRSWDSRFGPESSSPTWEWPDHPARPPGPAADGEEDIEDAVIVDHGDGRTTSGPHLVTTGVKGLPRSPEPHTRRPGTTRPTSKEDSHVSNTRVTTRSAQGGLAAKHRTDITYDEYLVEMANIAIAAAAHRERAEALAGAVGKVADALREMAADLVADHNIATSVTDLITGLADAAGRMKSQAQRCAYECGIASTAAQLAAAGVARVYGQDMAAKEDAGLTYASAAAHHD